MGTRNNPSRFDGYTKAAPDEPTFTLLARDPSAPALVEKWADERDDAIVRCDRPASDYDKVKEARALAQEMRDWHAKHRP